MKPIKLIFRDGNFKHDDLHVFTSLAKLRKYPKEYNQLIFDFSSCTFFNPLMLVLIGCIAERACINGQAITFIKPENIRARKYLEEIRLEEYWEGDFKRKNYTNVAINSHLCLWQVSIEMVDAYLKVAQDFATQHWINELDVTPLYNAIQELLNNVNDHSGSNEIAYTVSQYIPVNSKLDIAVCDFGVGIAQRIMDYMKDDDLTEHEALKKAFELEFSTKSKPHNRGRGLDTILTYAKELNGSIHLYSNGLHFWYDSQIDDSFHSEKLPSRFDGTLLNLKLSTKSLDSFDKEEYIGHVQTLGG